MILVDQDVLFELVQLAPEVAEGAILLASFQRNVRDFLYPYPQLLPSYGSSDREVLMEKSWDFPVSVTHCHHIYFHFVWCMMMMIFVVGLFCCWLKCERWSHSRKASLRQSFPCSLRPIYVFIRLSFRLSHAPVLLCFLVKINLLNKLLQNVRFVICTTNCENLRITFFRTNSLLKAFSMVNVNFSPIPNYIVVYRSYRR